MTRLIDADELKEIINWTFASPPFSRKTVRKMIDMTRTVDAVPVKHGKWVRISPAKIYECSECGQTILTGDIECYKFCHGCGARMDEK